MYASILLRNVLYFVFTKCLKNVILLHMLRRYFIFPFNTMKGSQSMVRGIFFYYILILNKMVKWLECRLECLYIFYNLEDCVTY